MRQWFSLMTSSLVKIIAESPHSWQKSGIHGNPYIILYILFYLYILYIYIVSSVFACLLLKKMQKSIIRILKYKSHKLLLITSLRIPSNL